MPIRVTLRRFLAADDAEPRDRRPVELAEVPAAGDRLWWHEPYRVVAVGGGGDADVDVVLDAERWLEVTALLPQGFRVAVTWPPALGAWDAIVMNVEGGVRGYGRDDADADVAAERALRDAGFLADD